MKKKSFNITILKKDLEKAQYANPTDCAIARAIKRFGGKVNEPGMGVDCTCADFVYKKKTFAIYGVKYRNMSDKVHEMMSGRKTPRTFSVKLMADIVE